MDHLITYEQVCVMLALLIIIVANRRKIPAHGRLIVSCAFVMLNYFIAYSLLGLYGALPPSAESALGIPVALLFMFILMLLHVRNKRRGKTILREAKRRGPRSGRNFINLSLSLVGVVTLMIQGYCLFSIRFFMLHDVAYTLLAAIVSFFFWSVFDHRRLNQSADSRIRLLLNRIVIVAVALIAFIGTNSNHSTSAFLYVSCISLGAEGAVLIKNRS